MGQRSVFSLPAEMFQIQSKPGEVGEPTFVQVEATFRQGDPNFVRDTPRTGSIHGLLLQRE
jgi:hypothetical protein